MGDAYVRIITYTLDDQKQIERAIKHLDDPDAAPRGWGWTMRPDGTRASEWWWHKSQGDATGLARMFSQWGASGRVSVVEYDHDLHSGLEIGTPPPCPVEAWRAFTARAPHNRRANKRNARDRAHQ